MSTTRIKVPTGDICTMDGERGQLEFLSLGDYGKAKNIKADFLGLPNEIEGVPHGALLPLTEKWVITISSQYGCSMGCRFCDVPKVGPGINATVADMFDQIDGGLSLHPEITSTKRLNIHFARMGEPTLNPDVLTVARMLLNAYPQHRVHPVVSTMMPIKNEWLEPFLKVWCKLKNEDYRGNAGLQLSINSTDESERYKMFRGNALPLWNIGDVMARIPAPVGRKYTLNFALADYTIDVDRLLKFFPPERFICKLTPMHRTAAAEKNGIRTEDGYTSYTPYRETELALKSGGYDVIVFVPSLEEDESRITCGNAILCEDYYDNGGGR